MLDLLAMVHLHPAVPVCVGRVFGGGSKDSKVVANSCRDAPHDPSQACQKRSNLGLGRLPFTTCEIFGVFFLGDSTARSPSLTSTFPHGIHWQDTHIICRDQRLSIHCTRTLYSVLDRARDETRHHLGMENILS